MMVPDDVISRMGGGGGGVQDPCSPSGSAHDQMDEKSVDHEAINLKFIAILTVLKYLRES